MRGNPGDLMHTLRRMKMQEKRVQNLPNRALPNVLPKKNTGSIGKNKGGLGNLLMSASLPGYTDK